MTLPDTDAFRSPDDLLAPIFNDACADAGEIFRLRTEAEKCPPIELRRRISEWFERRESSSPRLVLLFGSVARGELARDTDILYVVPHETAMRRYKRLPLAGTHLDINVATSAWLRSAWSDPEWGYCLSESFILGTPSAALEALWRQVVEKYWTRAARTIRIRSHIAAAHQLMKASAETPNGSIAPLLAHEALRIAMMPLIEMFGERVYSHRSFIAEFIHAGHRAGVDSRDIWHVVVALSGDSRRPAQSYVDLRHAISELLRSTPGYDAALSRDDRIWNLIEISATLRESCIALSALSRLRHAFEVALRTTEVVERHFTHVTRRARAGRAHGDVAVPSHEPSAGTRWVEVSGRRVKVVVGTGGCKTASCVFCTLPAYGRATEVVNDLRETIRPLLQQYKPQQLSLYNDGNVLNPAELRPEHLLALLKMIGESGVRLLDLESIPRFVTDDILKTMLRELHGQLGIAMGLQAAANWASVKVLGRPDPQCLFDRAITLLHGNGASVRLYLLWGFPAFDTKRWGSLLRSSISWARARRVERVTVCPYVSTDRVATENSLCELRAQLAAVSTSTIAIDVALSDNPSCGVENLHGCAACFTALRQGYFANGARCLARR